MDGNHKRYHHKKWIGIIIILLSALIVFRLFLNLNSYEKDDFFGEFLKELYTISYDEYHTMIEDEHADMETFKRKDKFQHFFTPKGFENFLSDRLSVIYIHEVIDKKCDVELVSYTGELRTEPYQFYYDYKADKFFYDYEVVVNIISLIDGIKTTKTEKGTISGYIIDDEYKINSIKHNYQIFK